LLPGKCSQNRRNIRWDWNVNGNASLGTRGRFFCHRLAGPFQGDSISNRKTIASATPRLEVDPRELKITAATVWRDLPPLRSGVLYVRPVPTCGYVLIGSRACHQHIRQSISDSGTGDTPAG